MNRKDFNPKVGDIVRIRKWKDMENEFGLDEFGNIKCTLSFVDEMRVLEGEEFEITQIIDGKFFGHSSHRFNISADMLEPTVDVDFDTEEISKFLDSMKII